VHNLISGTEYNFRIRAENPDGAGIGRELAHAVVPKPVIWRPAAPAGVEVTAVSDDSVTLAWLSPERDGGARIFRYIVELQDVTRAEGWVKVREVSASDHLMATIDGLKEGKPYHFRVAAENEVGPGPAYELPEPVAPRAFMGAPASPQGPLRVLRVTRNMLAVHWRPPRDNGGALISRYVVEKRHADRSIWSSAGVCASDVTTHCITDLEENQMYYIRVMAENAYGRSAPLDSERPIVPRRIYESARDSEVESWVHEAQVDAAEVSRVMEQTRHVSITQTSSSMMASSSSSRYAAYSDEPLTRTADSILETMRLQPRF
jgi:titin